MEHFQDTVNCTKHIPIGKTIKVSSPISGDYNINKVMLIQNDTLTLAQEIHDKFPDKKVAILNFANNDSFCDRKFGGRTQEENIAQRANLFHVMSDDLYPIAINNGPDCLVRRKIQMILSIAGGYDIFITGAWGMGAFHNPEYGLISLWNEALVSTKTKKQMTCIFTIPNDDYTMKCFKLYLSRRH